MVMICPLEAGGSGRGEGRSGRSKKRMTNKNSDDRHGRPHGSNSVRVSDERKRRKHGRWCGVPIHRRDRGGYGLVLCSHYRNGGSYRKMNKVMKGYFCRAYKALLPPLPFAGKQSEGHGYKIEEIWNRKQL